MTLTQFWQQQYGSADNFLNEFLADIAKLAEPIGIDIYNFKQHLIPNLSNGQEIKLTDRPDHRFAANKKTHGCAIWVKSIQLKSGVEVYSLTLRAKGETEYWDGYKALEQEFQRSRGVTTKHTPDHQQLARQEKRRKQQQKAEQQAQQLQQLHAQIKCEYLKAFELASNGQHCDYLSRKKVQQAAMLPNVRQIKEYWDKSLKIMRPVLPENPGSGQIKTVTVIPLARLGEQPAGLQRFSLDGKFQTTAVNDGDYKAAFFTLGKLSDGQPIDICEGFATAATAWMATNNATVFAVSADNIQQVIPVLLQSYPNSTIRHITDNDIGKYKLGRGNKGWLNGLEMYQRYGHKSNFKVVLPDMGQLQQATDINDIHCRHPHGLAEVSRQLKNNKLRINKSQFSDRFELAMKIYQAKSHQHQCRPSDIEALARVGMALAPIKYSPEDIKLAIIGAAKMAGNYAVPVKKVAKVINTLADKAIWLAQRSRSFSKQKLQGDNIIYKRFNGQKITGEIFDYINQISNGLIILRAPMASGKTQALIKPLMDQQGRSTYTAHRVSLIAGACEALNKRKDANGHEYWLDESLSIKHYQNDLTAESAPFIHKLATCINSIVNPLPAAVCQRLDQLFIDEAAQTMDAITIGGAMHAPQAVFHRLQQLMQTSRRVVLCDADANDNLIHLCEIAAAQRDNPQIHIIELETDASHIKVQFSDIDTVTGQIAAAAESGERVLIATDNCAEAISLHDQLQELTGKTGMIITGQNKSEDQQQEFQSRLNHFVNANGETISDKSQGIPWLQHIDCRWLIYSPAITSGVSVEVPWFTQHFALFHGLSVTPAEAIQMLRRDRTTTTITMGIKSASYSGETDPNRIISGFMKADRDNDTLRFEINDNHEIIAKTNDPQFDNMRARCLATTAAARANFANNLLWCLYADKYKISRVADNPANQARGKLMVEQGQEKAKVSHINMVSGAATPDEVRFQALQSKKQSRGLNGAEQAELIRHEIANQMQMPVNEETILWHRNGAISQIRRFELLKQPTETLAEYDRMQQDNGIAASLRDYTQAKQNAYKELFSILGIDMVTGQGETDSNKIRAAFAHFIANENKRDLHNAVLRIGSAVRAGAMSKADETKWVKSAIEKLGNKLVRTTRRYDANGDLVWHYQLNAQLWQSMTDIITKRNAAQINAWQPGNGGTTGPGAVGSQCADSIKHPVSTVKQAEKEKSLLKQRIEYAKQWCQTVGIPFSYAKRQLDKADRTQLTGSPRALVRIRAMIRDLWRYDHPEKATQ